MIEPKLIKIEAVDEPEISLVQNAVEKPSKPNNLTIFRALFRRHKPTAVSSAPADVVRV